MTMIYDKQFSSPFLLALLVLLCISLDSHRFALAAKESSSACSSAQEIASLPFEIRDSFPNTLHAEVDFDLQYCNDDVGPLDSSKLGDGRWYKYNPSNDTIITFQMKEDEGGSSFGIPNLLFFSGSCDSIQCIHGGGSGGLESKSFLAEVDQGPFYFWIYCESNFENECDKLDNFVFSVVLDEVPTQLTCDTAEIMTVPFESREFFPSSLFADVDSDLQRCSDGVGSQNSSLLGPGRWYQYVPTRDTIVSFLVEEDQGGSILDLPNILFFSGECDSLNCLGSSTLSGLEETLLVEVDLGPFYFWVYCGNGFDGECSNTGNYVFTVIEHPVPENDSIENATEIVPPLILDDYTIIGAFSDFAEDPCALSGLVYGVYFQYTPVATEAVTLAIEYSIFSMPFIYMNDPMMGIFTISSDGTRECLARAGTTIDNLTLEGGVTHYILIASPVPGAFDTFQLRFQVSSFLNMCLVDCFHLLTQEWKSSP